MGEEVTIPRGAAACARSVAFLICCASAAAGASDSDIQQLSAPDPAARVKAYKSLKADPAAAMSEVFINFSDAPPIARELRARLVREVGTIAEVDAASKIISDPHPLVRLELAEFFARPDFVISKAEERAAILLEFARDPEYQIRDAAFKGLSRLADRAAIAGLLALVRDGSADQRERALRALAATPGSAPALISIANPAAAWSAADRRLWLLSLGFTGDPAALPVLLKYAKHPGEGSAASGGFDVLTQRLIFRRRDAELLQVLEAWRAVDPVDAAWRLARFQLLVTADLDAASAAARALDAAAEDAGQSRREWRAIARAVLGIIQLTRSEGAPAEAEFARAYQFASARPPLGEEIVNNESTIMLKARLRVLSAYNSIINSFDGAPDPKPLLEEAYELFKERVYQSTARSLQPLYSRAREDEFTFNQLNNILFNAAGGNANAYWSLSANWNFDAALETEIGAMSAIATVLPKNGRGAAGLAAGRKLLELLSDINPREFITDRHLQDWRNSPDPYHRLHVYDVPAVPISPVVVSLTLSVSSFPRDLGQFARAILGDLAAAAELLEPVIARAAEGQQMTDLTTFVDASLERAGVAMDAGDPDAAEKYINRVLSRLDQVKKDNEEQFDKESVRMIGAASAEARTSQAKLWLDYERRARAQTLISKAVNENVVRGRPEVASQYAKKGCELDPTEFNKVLLACYLAREGNNKEARAVLRDASQAPGTYYNLACTYALLGEPDTSLYYLERDFREHADRGGLERQRAWARKDPDLKSLRDDPRFLQLVAPEGAASKPTGDRR